MGSDSLPSLGRLLPSSRYLRHLLRRGILHGGRILPLHQTSYFGDLGSEQGHEDDPIYNRLDRRPRELKI